MPWIKEKRRAGEETNKDRIERLNNCLGAAVAVAVTLRPLTKITDQVSNQCATVAVFSTSSPKALSVIEFIDDGTARSLSLSAAFLEHISLKLASIQNRCGHKTEPLNFSVQYLQRSNKECSCRDEIKRDCNAKKRIEANKCRNSNNWKMSPGYAK